METKLLTYILIGIIGLMGWVIVDEKYINPDQVRTETDTVYVDKPFKVETIKPADQIIPETITLYKTEYQEIQALELVGDTIKVYVDSSSTQPLLYDSRFLTSFPFAPKFLELELTETELTFTGLRINGETQANTYSLDLAQNNYRMAPDGNGWVALEADRASGWLGLDLKLSHGIGVGMEWALSDGVIIQYPYLEYTPSLQLKKGINLDGTVGIAPDLFGSVGLGYRF